MKFDQCLFGYDDGHRLLASSLPLGSETSLLTELSDLAPGTVFRQSEGYWTGVPAPVLGRYVLMRTWPAPEMSRPGCVWTHALVIDLALLESLNDLSVLQNIPVRPGPILNLGYYREPITVDLVHTVNARPKLDDTIVKRLIVSLYADGGPTIGVNSPGELDEALFAVWSQQWPRLRRNFRFQTATSSTHRPSSFVRFDIAAVLAPKNIEATQSDAGDMQWLTDVALDVQQGTTGPLRQFLRTYGRDVRKQRGSFRPLVEIKAMDSRAPTNSGQQLIDLVASAFPGLDDAKLLKQDLVDGELAPAAQAEIIRFVISNDDQSLFPIPTKAGINKLSKLWPKQSDEILRLGEITADASGALSKSIFKVIINCIPMSRFWEVTTLYPNIRRSMLLLHSELLISAEALTLDDATFVDVLPLIPQETQGIPELIFQLLARDSECLAKIAFERFPNVTAAQVLSAANSTNVIVAAPWWRELKRKPKLLLQREILCKVSRASLLYKIADSIGWVTPEVTSFGPGPWISALKNASFDLWNEQADTFNCFILALALKAGGEEGREAIEKFFDAVHRKVLKSNLYWRGEELLFPLLPNLGWMSNWDLGLRLRVAVATAYVDSDWPASSYALLSPDKKSRLMLAETAADLPGGSPYADAAKFGIP